MIAPAQKKQDPLQGLLASLKKVKRKFVNLSRREFKEMHPDPCWVIENHNASTWLGLCSISICVFSSKKLACKYMRIIDSKLEGFCPKKYMWNDLVEVFAESNMLAVLDYAGEELNRAKCVPFIKD